MTATLQFDPDGAECLKAALGERVLAAFDAIFAGLPSNRAGLRLPGIPALRPLLSADGQVGSIAAAVLGPAARPVRAVLFDKTRDANWRVGWHQDRTIVVRARADTPGFGPWSVKAGHVHVAPPFGVLAGMVTLRIHFDPVGPENGPLQVAPGSHRLGRIAETEIAAAVRQCGAAVCLADRGDVWLNATPILHASEVATQPTHRRVLHLDYAAGELPAGLAWLGV